MIFFGGKNNERNITDYISIADRFIYETWGFISEIKVIGKDIYFALFVLGISLNDIIP